MHAYMYIRTHSQLSAEEIRATHVVKSLRIQGAADLVDIIRKSQSAVFKPSQVGMNACLLLEKLNNALFE